MPDATADACDYEDLTTGETARVPVIVDSQRGQAQYGYRVCRFELLHWPSGASRSVRMRSVRTSDGTLSDWTTASLDRPASAQVTLALVGGAVQQPPPDPPQNMATDTFPGSGVLASPWVDYRSASTAKLTQSGGVVVPSFPAESTGFYYGGAASGNNQFSEIVIAGSLGAAQTYWTAAARVSGNNGTRQAYQATATSNRLYITKVVAGADAGGTDVAASFNGSSTPVALRIETEDSGSNVLVRAYKDGVLAASWTDTSSVLTGGQPGLEVYAHSSFITPVAEWSGGDWGGGGVVSRVPRSPAARLLSILLPNF
jgi:hypothetical protein